MSIVNLTLPLYPDMPVGGGVWPHEMPFQMEPIRTWEKGGAQLEYYQFHTETGTRILTRARHDPAAPGLGALDFADLVDVPAVVVDIEKGADEVLGAAEVERYVSSDGAYREGDGLLIRTGWSDASRCRELGEDFVLKSPRFDDDGARALAGVLRSKRTRLLCIDTTCLVGHGAVHARKEWTSMPTWHRPPWPSDNAKAYLRAYGPKKQFADWGGDRTICDAANVVLAIGGARAITSKRVLLTALPLFVEDAPCVPTTVIAKPA